jgi:hypothetical protein
LTLLECCWLVRLLGLYYTIYTVLHNLLLDYLRRERYEKQSEKLDRCWLLGLLGLYYTVYYDYLVFTTQFTTVLQKSLLYYLRREGYDTEPGLVGCYAYLVFTTQFNTSLLGLHYTIHYFITWSLLQNLILYYTNYYFIT